MRLRRIRRLLPALPLLALLSVLLADATGVSAHALLVRSDPSADSVLQVPPTRVLLQFSENLNVGASRIVVWNRYRQSMTSGTVSGLPGNPSQLQVGLKHLPAGSYLVLWISVSADDGHILRGSFLFSVKRRGPGPSLAGVNVGNSQDVHGSETNIVLHWLELLAAVVWAGTLTVALFVLPAGAFGATLLATERSYRQTLLRACLVALFLSSLLLLLSQAQALGGSATSVFSPSVLREVLGAQYGLLLVAREVVVAVAFACTFPPIRPFLAQGETGQVALPHARAGTSAQGQEAGAASSGEVTKFLFALSLLYLYLFAGSGHAASAQVGVVGDPLFSLSVLLDWLHFLGVSTWFGGQMYLALVLLPALDKACGARSDATSFLTALQRYSPFAYASIAIFTLTGLFNGKVHIPSWYAYFHSIYGISLTIKIGLIGLMMLVSVYTVYCLRPRLRARLDSDGSSSPLFRRLARWLRVNPILGAGVVLITSVMFYFPVPIGLSPPGPSSYLTGAAGLTARTTISPDRSGPNTVNVSLSDASGGPVSAATVSVLTTMLDMSMGTGIAPLHRVAPGKFSGSAELGMGGRWRLELLIYRPSGLIRMSIMARVGS